MPNAEEVARQIAVHGAVCAERWKQTNTRLSRIEIVLGVHGGDKPSQWSAGVVLSAAG